MGTTAILIVWWLLNIYIYRWWFSGYCQCLMVIVIVDGYNGRSHRFVLTTCTLLLFSWLHVVFVSLCRRCSKRSSWARPAGKVSLCVWMRHLLWTCWARHPACAGCLTYLWRETGKSYCIVWQAAAMGHTTGFPEAQKSILSWLEQYHSWHTATVHTLLRLYCFMLVVWALNRINA